MEEPASITGGGLSVTWWIRMERLHILGPCYHTMLYQSAGRIDMIEHNQKGVHFRTEPWPDTIHWAMLTPYLTGIASIKKLFEALAVQPLPTGSLDGFSFVIFDWIYHVRDLEAVSTRASRIKAKKPTILLTIWYLFAMTIHSRNAPASAAMRGRFFKSMSRVQRRLHAMISNGYII